MNEELRCPRCNSILKPEDYEAGRCPDCPPPDGRENTYLTLRDYGYTIKRGRKGWMITSPDGTPITVTSPGEKTARKLSESFRLPFNIVAHSLAEANEPDNVAEIGKEKRSLIDESMDALSEFYFKTPDDIEALYVFRDGEYVRGEAFVKGFVESMFENVTNTGLCEEVVNHLKRRSYVPRSAFNSFYEEIPVLNGLLNLDTGAIIPFTPDKIFTFKIQAKYDPTKRSDKWIKFMEEVLPNEEDRKALQEYAGYTLYIGLPFHKLAFLVGNGRNGKGVFVRTVQGILGSDNVSNIPIEHLNGSHRFAATNLYGKLMNISSEPSTRYPLQTEQIKQLTGEDWVDGEVKGKQDPVRFQPFAKHFVLANKLPKVDDNSVGWWERVLLVMFDQTFTEEKGNQITDLEDTWLNNDDDRSGILNWLIEGWIRLRTNRRFTQSKTQREAMILFKRVSDPISAFLAEECEKGAEYYELRDALYDAFKDYAKSLNATIEGTRTFIERLRAVPGINVDRKKRLEGKAQRVVMGLRLKRREEEVENLDEFLGEADEADEAPPTSRQKTEKTTLKERDMESISQEQGEDIAGASNASRASPPEATPSKVPLVDAKLVIGKVVEAVKAPLTDNPVTAEKKTTPFEVRRRILDVISKNRGVSSDFIASQLHLSDSDTERYLRSLEREGVIFRTPDGLWRMS